MFVACHEDLVEEVIITDEYTPYTVYEIDIRGLVSDENGDPIANATLTFESAQNKTDDLGHFVYTDVSSNTKNAVLSIAADGYISASRLITVLSPTTINLSVKLIKIPDEQSFDAESGGVIEVSDQATVSFSPNGIVKNDQGYQGQVYIRSYHLAKNDPDLFSKLPGDLVGIDKEEELQVLDTYGMMYVTLEDENGNELQPDAAETAILTINIPQEYSAQAPAQIPLWFFDESKGVWIEDGFATRKGAVYEGAVRHFTWWNIDIPVDKLVSVCMDISDVSTGQALANQDVLFSSQGIEFGIQRTNNDGELCISLPANHEISLQLATTCQYSSQSFIGPFSTSQDDVKVELGTNEAGTVNISGTVTDCNGQLTDQGIAALVRDGNRSAIDISSDGSFIYNVVCPRDGEIIKFFIYDSTTEKSVSKDIVVDINSSNIQLDLQVCEEAEDLVIGNFFGIEGAFSVESIKMNPNETILVLDNNCYFAFLGNTTGTFEGAYYCGLGENGEINVVVKSFDSVISGTFSGNNISGTFSANNN